MMGKKKLVVIIFMMLCIGKLLTFENLSYIKSENRSNLILSIKFWHYQTLMIKDKAFVKIIGTGKENVKVQGRVRTSKKEYILLFLDDTLNIYSTDEKIAAYKIGNQKVISCAIADLNKDEKDEILLITGKKGEVFGDELLILSFDGVFKEIYKKHFNNLNPWKVQTADIDGDGKKEISIGVYKKTKFHPVMAKRPYIYNWHEGITPKWRGSRLSKPFDDYIFADIDDDKMDEIVAVEILKDGNYIINGYKWKGFGFEGIGESQPYEKIYEIVKDDENNKIYAKVKIKDQIGWVCFVYRDGKWIGEGIKDYVPIIHIKEGEGKGC